MKKILPIAFFNLLVTYAMAQDKSDCPPKTQLTAYIAKQTHVCPPHGYQRGNAHSCPKINKDKIKEWKADRQLLPAESNGRFFPPDEIRLSEDQVRIASSQSREAILLEFHFGISKPEGATVTFDRIGDTYRSIGELQDGGTWFNHQNARAFIPASNTKWKLVVTDSAKNQWSCVLRVPPK